MVDEFVTILTNIWYLLQRDFCRPFPLREWYVSTDWPFNPGAYSEANFQDTFLDLKMNDPNMLRNAAHVLINPTVS